MGFTNAVLAVPSPAHLDSKLPEVSVTPLVDRKHSFRGFSASSLSSLALGHRHNKRNSIGSTKKGLNFIMSTFRDAEQNSDASRPPSLLTDDSSLTSSSSRSPSPEPATSTSRIGSAFKNYTLTLSAKVLQNDLLPILHESQSSRTTPSASRPSTSRKTSLTSKTTSPSSRASDVYLLEESDVNILFKWWNHLLLLARPSNIIIQAIYAIAAHPTTRLSPLWNAHYELTLSTILSHSAAVLPSTDFAKLISLGYLYHTPTFNLLRNLFADPTKVSSSETWAKRAKNVEVFIETSKHVFAIDPTFDDGGIIEARLEELLGKVINMTVHPNHRLSNLCRLLAGLDGEIAKRLEFCLLRVAHRVGVFECVAGFFLLEVLSVIRITQIASWMDILKLVMSTENHILQIRVFALLYDTWPIFQSSVAAYELLLSPTRWEYFFTHWSGIVRDHYMRLVAYRLCLSHPHQVRASLLRSFNTSLQENCQLRDCLPSNPIPNKRFFIRAINTRSQPYLASIVQPRHDQVPSSVVHDAVSDASTPSVETTTGFVKKRLGIFRGLWSDDAKDDTISTHYSHQLAEPKTISPATTASPKSSPSVNESQVASLPTSQQQQQFKFVPEYVGKQWSLTSDADAIMFLDSVMDMAREGRLPLHAYPLPTAQAASPDDETEPLLTDDLSDSNLPYELQQGRKRLWTRSLSEWSALLDETDRFWRTCGGRSIITHSDGAIRRVNCPRLEVEFPRWFVQRATQVAGEGLDRI